MPFRVTIKPPQKITRIVNVSGGAASAVCLFRVIERFGTANIAARFADVGQEHQDLYRFIDDVERVSGVKIERLSAGKSCWDVWMQEAMLTNPQSGGCLASYHLKKTVLNKHAESIASPEDAIIYVGFGPDEDDRMRRLEASGNPWRFDYPLTWRPQMGRCDVLRDLEGRGVRTPSLYDSGYAHNNCAGACILAGIKQWVGLLHDDRELFLRNEAKEQEFLALLRGRGRKEQTILKDRRGGTTKNLSLLDLRREVEAGIRHNSDSWREESCSCMGDLHSP